MYEIGNAEVNAVKRVILSKKLFRYQAGDNGECDRFEREFAAAFGVKHALILSSGTNALVAGLVAAGVGEGDEVLVPAYTFVATAAAVVLAGGKPVIVNVDDELGISVEDARQKVTKRTKAIIPVHMDGLAADLAGIRRLAGAHRLTVIEDCAQALGGSFGKKRLGSHGTIGAFSLNENKVLSCGEGGVVVTSSRDVYEKLFCMQDLSARYNPVKKEQFKAPAFLGMSMRVSEIQGAIMRAQLPRLDSILKRLRARKRLLVEALAGLPGTTVVRGHSPEGECGSSLHLRFEDPSRANVVSRALMANGVLASFPTLRPAHVAWKWIREIDPEGCQAVAADLLPSMAIMMSTLKYDLELSLSLAETGKLAKKIRRVISTARQSGSS